MSKTYCLYKHIDPFGKMYIGITSQKVNLRWRKGTNYKKNLYFTSAINKYGWDNFKHEIVRSGLTKEQAEIAEIAMIRHYNTRNKKFGYNLSKGGKINSISKEGKERLREKAKKQVHKKRIDYTEEEIEKCIEYNAIKKSVRCIETGIIYRSTREAGRQLNICHSGISRVCNQVYKYKTCGGYHWEYVT